MASKRKRDSQDMPHMRAAPGMSSHTHDFDPQYFDGADQAEGMDFGSMLAQHSVDQGGNAIEEDDSEDAQDQPQSRGGNQRAGPSASDTAAAAMAQYHTMTIPQTTEQTFMQQQGGEQSADRQGSDSADPAGAQQRTSSFGDFDVGASKDGQEGQNGDTSPTIGGLGGTPKPAVGSDEWHKVRRDNHKEVERRRRETINEGINELAKIVPGCEKNKGSILARAVQFITQLKENETQNIEKWTLEKLLTEQAIAELSSSCDKLKAECQRAWAECEQWKKAAQKAGVSVSDEKDDADGEDEG